MTLTQTLALLEIIMTLLVFMKRGLIMITSGIDELIPRLKKLQEELKGV